MLTKLIMAKVVKNSSESGKGLAGFILGIISVCLCWIPFLGLILSVIAIILSGLGMRAEKRGFAIAGLVLGIIALIPAVIISLVFVVVIATTGTIA